MEKTKGVREFGPISGTYDSFNGLRITSTDDDRIQNTVNQIKKDSERISAAEKRFDSIKKNVHEKGIELLKLKLGQIKIEHK